MYRPAALERRAAIEAALGRTSAASAHLAELMALRPAALMQGR